MSGHRTAIHGGRSDGRGCRDGGAGAAASLAPREADRQSGTTRRTSSWSGSGVGACTAAVIAHENGDSVVMLEKAPILGGTSAKSAGVLWIPNNFALRANGIDDKKEDCLRFLARFSYPEKFIAWQPDLGLTRARVQCSRRLRQCLAGGRTAARIGRAAGRRVAHVRARPSRHRLPGSRAGEQGAGRAAPGPIKPDGTMGLGVDLMFQLGDAVAKRRIPILLGTVSCGSC